MAKNKNKILVTGGSGYIGSVLVKQLLDKGYDVRVLDSGMFGHSALDEVKSKIELIEEDIRTCKKDVFRDVFGVLHLAGFSNDPTAEYRPKENYSVNVEGTRRVIELAKKAGVERFVFASSCSVYYTVNPDNIIKKEKSAINPTAPYSLSKHIAEDVVLDGKSKTFIPVVLRQGTIYGLSPRMRYDLAVNTLSKDAYIDGRMTLHLGGRMWRPFLDVEDAAKAYIFCLEAPKNKISGHIFNLVSTNILISDLADKIQSILKSNFKKSIDIHKQESGTARSYKVSGEKIKKIGFKPARSLDSAVKEIWMDLKKRQDLNDDKYYNIRVFEKIYKS